MRLRVERFAAPWFGRADARPLHPELSLRHDPSAMKTKSGSKPHHSGLRDLLASESRAQVLARLKARFERLPAKVSLAAELIRERRVEAEKEN